MTETPSVTVNQPTPVHLEPHQPAVPHQAAKSSGSAIGNERAGALKTARARWLASMAAMDNTQVGPRDVGHQNARAETISADDLRAARKHNLTKVPVYLAARDTSGISTRVGAFDREHGFVALGQPGKAGAKTFSYSGSKKHRDVNIDVGEIRALNDCDTYSPKLSDKSLDAFAAVKSAHGDHFRTIQDLHRAYFVERMKLFNNENKPDDRAKFPEAGDYDKAVDALRKEIASDVSQVIVRNRMGKGNELELRERYPKGKYAREDIPARSQQPGLKHGRDFTYERDDASGAWEKKALPDDHVDQTRMVVKQPKQDKNFADYDVDMFEGPGDAHLLVNEVKGLNATDVLEAHQTQTVARNWLDEKAGVTDDVALAPELLGPIDDAEVTDGITPLDAQIAKATGEIERRTYDGVYVRADDKQKKGWLRRAFGRFVGLDKEHVMDKDRISAGRSYKKINVWNRITQAFARLFRSRTERKIANSGNCNSAAGSLLRFAAKQSGKSVSIRSGAGQFGVTKDVYWDPTPGRKPGTTSAELEAKGMLSKPLAEDLEALFRKKENGEISQTTYDARVRQLQEIAEQDDEIARNDRMIKRLGV